MLFNSYLFIFLFLPITLLGFHLLGKRGYRHVATGWLVGASLFFYGWGSPVYLRLILVSILFNYAVGWALDDRPQKLLLVVGIAVNLSLLGYFKYANFFVDNINVFTESNIVLKPIILPLAISFLTVHQVTYLVDAYRGETMKYDFLHYCLFVTFFPRLISGPIVLHKEIMPQFAKDAFYKLKAEHLAVGLTIFFIGLFKKVVLADGIAVYAAPVFQVAEHGVALTFFEAWSGALAYTFQLYFDFSGYSDMALGLARLFGVTLPANFFSPYKANNILDFWRCWHITLSRFFRDYLYIPLGGNRKGIFRCFVNLMIIMLLGGLWHGARWTFVIWGGLHGSYLVINHGWHVIKKKIFGISTTQSTFWGRATGMVITFTAVTVAWVLFRAKSINGALTIYAGMFGVNDISLPPWAEAKLGFLGGILKPLGIVYNGAFYNNVFDDHHKGILMLFLMLLVVWWTPNTLEWFKAERPALGLDGLLTNKYRRLVWQPSIIYLALAVIIAVIAIMFNQKESEFLYFQF